jgi:hypothetical protein
MSSIFYNGELQKGTEVGTKSQKLSQCQQKTKNPNKRDKETKHDTNKRHTRFVSSRFQMLFRWNLNFRASNAWKFLSKNWTSGNDQCAYTCTQQQPICCWTLTSSVQYRCGHTHHLTVKVPLSQTCFDHFFGLCFPTHQYLSWCNAKIPLSHHLSLNWTANHFPLCVVGACFLFGFCFVCSVALGVVSFYLLCFCTWIVTAAGLCTGPIPVHFCGPQPDGGFVYALIS